MTISPGPVASGRPSGRRHVHVPGGALVSSRSTSMDALPDSSLAAGAHLTEAERDIQCAGRVPT
jgi:hypothetical protein